MVQYLFVVQSNFWNVHFFIILKCLRSFSPDTINYLLDWIFSLLFILRMICYFCITFILYFSSQQLPLLFALFFFQYYICLIIAIILMFVLKNCKILSVWLFFLFHSIINMVVKGAPRTSSLSQGRQIAGLCVWCDDVFI